MSSRARMIHILIYLRTGLVFFSSPRTTYTAPYKHTHKERTALFNWRRSAIMYRECRSQFAAHTTHTRRRCESTQSRSREWDDECDHLFLNNRPVLAIKFMVTYSNSSLVGEPLWAESQFCVELEHDLFSHKMRSTSRAPTAPKFGAR